MRDIVFDTNLLADFIALYYECQVNRGNPFIEKYRINSNVIRNINKIVSDYNSYGFSEKGVVVCSSFGFVEIARQFQTISNNRFTLEQFKAFINSPPEWFVIESLSHHLFEYYKEIPYCIQIENKNFPIELPVAIHVVTTLSRGTTSVLCTTDLRIKQIGSLSNRII